MLSNLLKLIYTIMCSSIVVSFVYSLKELDDQIDRMLVVYVTITQLLGVVVAWYT